MKKYEFRELGSDEVFDPGTIYKNTPFTQADFYGKWQNSEGRTAKRFLAYLQGRVVAYFQIIKYPLIKDKSYLYIPYGPVTNDSSSDFLLSFKEKITEITKESRAIFTRIDFSPKVDNELLTKYFKKSTLYTYHSAYFQPRFEWFLNLKKSKEELLEDTHSDTRYSIRTAQKREVEVKIISEDFNKYFEDFYNLMNIAAKRNKFNLHPKKYYKEIFDSLSKIKDSYLSVATYNGKILIVDVIIVSSGIANYVFSGSSNEERNRFPSYLAIWGAICRAKDLDCNYFNFGGISPEGNSSYKGWDGLTKFKKKFGGEEIKHSDFFDVVINPFWYHIYNIRKYIKAKFRI